MIEGVDRDAPMEVNDRGGKQSATPYAFDLIDALAMFELARVHAEGAKKYGPLNWRRIEARSHLNHALQHAFAWLANDTQDDHLSHAVTRMFMALAVNLQGGPIDDNKEDV